MPITLRTAALALSAAVLSPVLPAAVAPAAAAPTPVTRASATTAAPVTADTVAGRAALAAWTARDARAKTTIAHLARRKAAALLAAYRAEATLERRAAADLARRDAAARATVAHLASLRAARAARASAADRPRATAATSVWDRLAQCESGGNWSISTGNGYYGGLQFSASSWRAVGGSGLPHRASKAEQITRGQLLQARAGWGSWPACSRKLGLG